MNQTFGDVLRERRTRMNLSQRAFSERLAENGLKIDPTSITRMENGQREPKLSEALALAEFLDIELNSLEYGDGQMNFHGYVESAVHAFFAARRALVDYLNYANAAVGVYKENPDDPDDMPRDEVAPFLREVMDSLIGREEEFHETTRALLPYRVPEFNKALINAVIRDLAAEEPVRSTENGTESDRLVSESQLGANENDA